MPDTATAPEPAAVAAPSTPAPDATPSGMKGIDAHMAAFDKAVTPKKVEPAKPKEDPTKTPEKGAAKPAPKPGEEPAPEDGQINWKKAPPRLAKAYEERTKELETLRPKIGEYEAKIKALESKKVEGPGDAKLIEEYQGKVKALEQELAVAAYERSTEFKTKYVDAWSNTYKSAVEEIKQLVVGEGEGEDRKERAATEADFRRILNLPLKDQGVMARRMFGDSADAVLAHRNDLNRIKSEGEKALEHAAKNFETTSKEKQLAEQKSVDDFKNTRAAALQQLREKHAAFFGDDAADEEGNGALKNGYEFVDSTIEKMQSGKMPLEEQAVFTALIHARAAAFPREVLRGKRLAAEVASLKDELSKLRKSDPGSGGDGGGGGGGGAEEPVGIAAMAAKFDKKA